MQKQKTIFRSGSQLIALVCLMWSCLGHTQTGPHAEAPSVWIDVRTPAEFDSGHVEGAIRIPYDGIVKGVEELKLQKDTTIYLYCASGGRAERAKQALLDHGYSSVSNMGGVDQARIAKEKLIVDFD